MRLNRVRAARSDAAPRFRIVGRAFKLCFRITLTSNGSGLLIGSTRRHRSLVGSGDSPHGYPIPLPTARQKQDWSASFPELQIFLFLSRQHHLPTGGPGELQTTFRSSSHLSPLEFPNFLNHVSNQKFLQTIRMKLSAAFSVALTYISSCAAAQESERCAQPLPILSQRE